MGDFFQSWPGCWYSAGRLVERQTERLGESLSQAGKGIFHSYSIGWNSVTKPHLPVREARALSPAVFLDREGRGLLATSRIPESFQPLLMLTLEVPRRATSGHVCWKPCLSSLSSWLSSSCYVWKYNGESDFMSHLEIRRTRIILSFFFSLIHRDSKLSTLF